MSYFTSSSSLSSTNNGHASDGGNVCVAVRIRPLIQREKELGSTSCWINDNKCLQQIDPDKKNPTLVSSSFGFDQVFSGKQKTIEVYNEVVSPIVNEAFNGFNGTILCYGQTSSGKTHTLYGSEEEEGLISLAANDIFKKISNDKANSYTVRVGVMEIYNEKISDLLSGNEVGISETNNTLVPKNLTDIEALQPTDVLEAIRKVQTQRKIGETRMNAESSRSHTILRILIEVVPVMIDDLGNSRIQVSSALLNFVDLAGSEKVCQTGAVGDRLRESTYINKSLSVLAQVVMQLTSSSANSDFNTTNSKPNVSFLHNSAQGTAKKPQSRYINFRDSKLTHYLKTSLSGNAFNTIICNVTPASVSVDETLSTLRFANSARRIKTSPTPNYKLLDDSESKQKIIELQAKLNSKQSEVDLLMEQLRKLSSRRAEDEKEKACLIPSFGDPHRRNTCCPGSLGGLRIREIPGLSSVEQDVQDSSSTNSELGKREGFMDSDQALHFFKMLEHRKAQEADPDSTLTESLSDIVPFNSVKNAQIQTSFTEPSTPKPVKREQNMETSSPPEPKRSKLSSSQAFDLIRQNLTKALVDQVQEVEQQKDFHSKELDVEKSRVRELEESQLALEQSNRKLMIENERLKLDIKDFKILQTDTATLVTYFKEQLLALRKQLSTETKDASENCELLKDNMGSNPVESALKIARETRGSQTAAPTRNQSDQSVQTLNVETKNASETCNLLNSCKDLVDCSTQSDSLPEIAKVTQGSQTTAPVRNQSDQNVQTLSVETKNAEESCHLLKSCTDLVDRSVQCENPTEITKTTQYSQTTALSLNQAEQSVQTLNVETKNSGESCYLLNSCMDLVDRSVQCENPTEITKATQYSQTTAPARNQSEQSVQTLNVETKNASESCHLLKSCEDLVDRSVQYEPAEITRTTIGSQATVFSGDKSIQTLVVQTKNAADSCYLLKSCKDLVDRSVQCENPTEITKATRECQATVTCRNHGVQTDQNLDLNSKIRDYAIKVKTLEAKVVQESQRNNKEKKARENTENELRNELAKKDEKVKKLKGDISLVKMELQQQLSPKTKIHAEVQCDLMTELIQRARKGEHGLLPRGFPDISGISDKNRQLEHRIIVLSNKISNCKCDPNLPKRYQPANNNHHYQQKSQESSSAKFVDDIEELLGMKSKK